ncbi:MAG TPA: hypothetical protein VK601_21825, partial [Kofleriaceae bacterium]|nr:hypothetical protein [Kofleriaceae bacterium]
MPSHWIDYTSRRWIATHAYAALDLGCPLRVLSGVVVERTARSSYLTRTPASARRGQRSWRWRARATCTHFSILKNDLESRQLNCR